MTVHELERRVLVLAPTVRDAANTTPLPGQAAIRSTVCRDLL